MVKLMKFLKFWLPPILWAIIIFRLSSNVLPSVGPTYLSDFAFKKFSHVFFYAVLGILVYRALLSENIVRTKALYISIIVCLIYGIGDEIHQSFIPGRGPHIRDVVFDTIGSSLGGIWAKKYL